MYNKEYLYKVLLAYAYIYAENYYARTYSEHLEKEHRALDTLRNACVQIGLSKIQISTICKLAREYGENYGKQVRAHQLICLKIFGSAERVNIK